MKKIFLAMSVLASMLIAGCSQEEVAPPEENGKDKTYYMTVNLVSSEATGSRATNVYEDGTIAENKITQVRFYFFNGVGGAVNVKPTDNGYVNYYDWIPGEGDQTQGPAGDSDDIESKLKATIVINTKEGDKVPQKMAALVNPRTALLSSESMSLGSLQQVAADYAAAGLTTEGKFVMFNSVYKSQEDGGIQVATTSITDKNLCEKEEDALKNPVTIYVERCVAKVRVTLDGSIGFDTNNRLKLKDKDNNDIMVEGQPVYLTLNGWDLTAETSEGRLVKKIDPKWEGAWVNGTYRSCWAINVMDATNVYGNYNSISTSFGNGNSLYTNENAQVRDVDDKESLAKEKTKVILKGTLCTENGTPITIVNHLGVYFVDDANLSKLKESFLTQLAVNGKEYYYETESGRNQIGTDDIQILAADQVDKENSGNNCYVYPQLTDEAKEKKTWYNSLDKNAQPIAADEINSALRSQEIVHKALVWNSGMTYYYYEIKHLKDKEGDLPPSGVVRNHIYATNVTKIAGLGTPVYDPGLTIYPEKPEPTNHYIAAEIDILSWHLVNNNYDIVW